MQTSPFCKVDIMFRKLSGVATLLLLSACTTTTTDIKQQSESFDYSTLFLRGSFSWWEADDKYKVISHGDSVYKVTVELVADGQPYDFKFADKDWTIGLSCGYKNQSDDENIQLNKSVSVNCHTPVNNFIFKPIVSGKYLFSIDFSNKNSPTLIVNKI